MADRDQLSALVPISESQRGHSKVFSRFFDGHVSSHYLIVHKALLIVKSARVILSEYG